jgi:hypothetical protein
MKIVDRIEQWDIDRLLPYAKNSRTHSEEQIAQIAASIKAFGFTNPILVGDDGVIVAGHGRLSAARKLGLKQVPVIVLDHLSDTERKALVIADNKLALNAGWNLDMLALEIADLKDSDFNIDLLGFNEEELTEILDVDLEQDNPYTKKVEAPTYEPSGEKPNVKDLYDDSKAFEIIDAIKKAKIPQEEKDFLMLTAGRHVVLNFERIADYYAHSSKEVQELMELSALVIVDFDDAIKNGWVNLSKKIEDIYDEDEE